MSSQTSDQATEAGSSMIPVIVDQLKAEPMKSSVRVIKRYANRKLYDTSASCYVTLEDITNIIKNGEEVQVIDNRSGADLTSITLAQIIFETEKKQNFMPMTLLLKLVREGGEVLEIARGKVLDKVQETAEKLKAGLEGRLNDVLSNGLGLNFSGDVQDLARNKELKQQLLAGDLQQAKKALKDLLAAACQALTHLQGSSPEGAPTAAGVGQNIEAIKNDLQTMQERLEILEKQLS